MIATKPATTYRLTKTCSYYENKQVKTYGYANDVVTLVGDHGSVLIVTNKNGQSFPVQLEDVEEV